MFLVICKDCETWWSSNLEDSEEGKQELKQQGCPFCDSSSLLIFPINEFSDLVSDFLTEEGRDVDDF